ncbi:MAG: GntR family transcriptional regulator [Opitutales bacterium]|nr:GntR family transcriptional regulator [Opitutales bacterium]MBT5813109.1 GntR family transcriptional regulator [Opitutales bacterium]MBT6381481.1 GntR family transcriptional regulator [Opitutales bacterium]
MNISEYIENDLREKIRSGGPLPARLTLDSLAKEYEVSLTPVRVALEHLIDLNYVLKSENGRLSLNPRRRARKQIRKRKTNQSLPMRNWDEIITEDVIHQSIQGEPADLREESAAQRYGVGRTVVQQVFNRLA